MASHPVHAPLATIARLGALRSLLLLATVAVIAAAPFADGTVHLHDWRLVPSVIAPSLMMMLVFALPLDMTMALVFRADADAAERERLGLAVKLDAFMLLALLGAWLPFLLKLLDA